MNLHSSMVRLETSVLGNPEEEHQYLHSSMVRLETKRDGRRHAFLSKIYIPVWLD